jgi:integrase
VALRHGGKLRFERIGRERKSAERALRRFQVKQDEGDYQPVQNVRFEEWADRWIASLVSPRASTKRTYQTTMDYAKKTFGHKQVRHVGGDDISSFLARVGGLAPSTQAKHLRHLHACFKAAIPRYAARNPVKALQPSQKPKAEDPDVEAPYFSDGELPKLFTAIVGDPLFRALCMAALKTGCRLGELAALKWQDVNLTDGHLSIHETYTDGALGKPKTRGSKRDVYVPPEVVTFLAEWWAECGKPDDSKLVFPAPTKSGYWTSKLACSRLYAAMTAAGIPRESREGKRVFHSWRHTHARIVLEQGRSLPWLQRQLGHSSLLVTTRIYGHLAKEHLQQEAGKLEGVYPV